MKLRRLLSLLLAAVLCMTIALSVVACGDDEPEETDAVTDPVDDVVDGGGDVADDGGDVADDAGGEDAAG